MLVRILFTLGLSGCAFANVTNNPRRNLPQEERAVPPARTSMDETDGPTQPRTSAQRPIGQPEENEEGSEQ